MVDKLVSHASCSVRVAVRSRQKRFSEAVEIMQVGDLSIDTDWVTALQDVDVVIHGAALVHVTPDADNSSLAAFRKVNVAGTLNLARQAVQAGVRRLVYLSSIKVNGEGTAVGKPYRADDQSSPVDFYGISKMEAEVGLQQLARETGLEVVIIRPPLVYGAGVKANFQSMMRWVDKGIPLPFGSIHNKRSFVAVDNLVDLLFTCIDHPAAVNQVFLAADGEDLSTPELLQRTAHAMRKTLHLLPLPAKVLELGALVLGKRKLAQRLCGSLQVDISKTCEVLGWVPPISVDEGLKKAVAGFKLKAK